MASDVWARSQTRLQKSGSGHVSFLNLMEEMMLKLTNEEMELFLLLCWVIWNQRNTIVHGGTLQDLNRLVQRATDLLEEFRDAQVQLAIPSQFVAVQTWTPPTGFQYKINFDAVMFVDIKASGFRVVIRNDKGEVMAALSVKGPPMMDSEEAEVLAGRKALEFALDSGSRRWFWKEITLESCGPSSQTGRIIHV